MKKRLPLLLISLLVLLASCQAPSAGNPSTNTAQSAFRSQQSDMWKVEWLNAELSESLTTTQAALQYDGGVIETTSEVQPGNGNTFLLMELVIEKIGTGRAAFSWNDAHIKDSNGNVYYRHPNDTFLANLGIPRLKGTDIVLGNESGYVCFEIPQAATGLQFIADDGSITIEVKP